MKTIYYSVSGCVQCIILINIIFQGAFAIGLSVWDDDSGNILGIGHPDDLVDSISYDVANVPAQKNLQSAVAKSITVRTYNMNITE